MISAPHPILSAWHRPILHLTLTRTIGIPSTPSISGSNLLKAVNGRKHTLHKASIYLAHASTAPPMDSYRTLFQSLASQHFQIRAYKWQSRVGGSVLHQHTLNNPIRLLCIQGTGKGKSVLYQSLSAHFKGVTVYISPLLTLGSDQVNKLMTQTRIMSSPFIPIFLDAAKNKAQSDEISLIY